MPPEEEFENRIMELETEAREKVSKSISAIEVALAEWDAAEKKPQKLAGKIECLRTSYELLSTWEKESLKGKCNPAAAKERLRKFIGMCKQLNIMKVG